MTTSASTKGTISPGTMANEISAARFAVAVIALGTIVSTLVLLTRTTVEADGTVSRPFFGQAIAVGTGGMGLVVILLFLAAWAGAWRDAQLGESLR